MTGFENNRHRGVRQACAWLAALMMSAMSAATSPGSLIENQASITFRNDIAGIEEGMNSNVVTTTVQAFPRVELFGAQQRRVGGSKDSSAGSDILLPHVLRNQGNVAQAVSLRLTSPSDSYNADSMRVWINRNENAVIDDEDQPVTPSTVLDLQPGDEVPLLLQATLREELPAATEAQLSLTASSDYGEVESLVVLTITEPRQSEVSIQVSSELINAEEAFQLRIAASSDTREPLLGRELIVDDTARSLVLLETVLPAGVQLLNPPQVDTFTLLFRTGQGYSEQQPADPMTLQAIAIAAPEIAANTDVAYLLELVAVGESRTVELVSTLQYREEEIQVTNAVQLENTSAPAPSLMANEQELIGQGLQQILPGDTLDLSFTCYSCDTDSTTRDRLIVELVSMQTGDREIFELLEVAPQSGVFTMTELPLARRSESAAQDDGVLNTSINDEIRLTVVNSEGGQWEFGLLIDPAGYVFNSDTGQPIVNAEVALYRVVNGENISLAEVYLDAGGTQLAQNPVRTDAAGMYEFPFVEQGDYRLVIQGLPDELSFTSRRSGAELAELTDIYLNVKGLSAQGEPALGRLAVQAEGASYGDVFAVRDEAVYIDIPVDPGYRDNNAALSNGLALSISADRREAAYGEAVAYNLRAKNISGSAVQAASIRFFPAPGFKLLQESVQWNGQPVRVERGLSAGEWLVHLGEMANAEEGTLEFRLVVTPGTPGGYGITHAQLRAQSIPVGNIAVSELFSQRVSHKVTLNDAVFHDEGLIIGKVFCDRNGDGLQNEEGTERGVSGVRFYLQNGRYSETDKAGRFSFTGLQPGTYVIKADRTRLQTAWVLTPGHLIDGQMDDIRTIDLTRGEMYRADFPLQQCPPLEPVASNTAPKTVASSAIESKSLTTNTRVTGLIQSPLDGSRHGDGQTTIALSGPLGVTFALTVNGEAVPATRIGEQVTDKASGQQHLSYYAVPLATGSNQIQAQILDQWGNVRGEHSIKVKRPGKLNHMQWQATQALTAESGVQQVELLLLDEQGLAISGDTLVTLEVLQGHALNFAWADTDLDSLTPGLQRLAIDGRLMVQFKSPDRAGQILLSAEANGHQAEEVLTFTPKLRDWIVAGVIEAEASHITGRSGALPDNEEHSGFSGRIDSPSTSSNEGRDRLAGRAAVFAKGTVKDDYLVTLIADSDKSDEEDWSGRPDLERDYPLVGDEAEYGAEGEASKGLYFRVEKEDSFVQVGDFRPGQDNRRTKLGAYQRKFYGAQQSYSGERWQVESFAARTSADEIIDDFRARGTSGPFRLSRQSIVPNSEQVEIITRTRAPDGEIIASESLQAFIDYELDPLTGNILLRAPLSGSDTLGRPRYLRVRYNMEAGEGLDRDVVGTDITYQASEHWRVGARALQEQDKLSEFTLSSVNTQYRLGQNTSLIVEVADSRLQGVDESTQGNAARIELEHQSEKRRIALNTALASSGFENPSSNINADNRSTGVIWQERLSRRQEVWGEWRAFEDQSSALDSSVLELGSRYAITDNLKLGLSLEEARTESGTASNASAASYSETSLGLHAQYRPASLEALTLESRWHQSLDGERERKQLGLDYRLQQDGSITANWEQLSGYTINRDLDDRDQQSQRWSAGYRQQVHSTTELYSEYRLEDSATGFDNSAATGLRFGYDISEGLRLVAQAERTLDLADNPQTPARYSTSWGLSGFKDDRYKWLGRVEMLAADDKRWLQEFRWAGRMGNSGWSSLLKERLQWRGNFNRQLLDVTAGLAYRPLRHNRWDWLGSLGIERDRLSETAGTDYQTLRNTFNVRPHRRWTLTGSAAVRRTEEASPAGYTSMAVLGRLRIRYQLNERWELGALGSHFKDHRLGGAQRGWGVEMQRAVGKRLKVAARYQHFGYSDQLDADSVYRRGISLHITGHFDERSLDGLLAWLD